MGAVYHASGGLQLCFSENYNAFAHKLPGISKKKKKKHPNNMKTVNEGRLISMLMKRLISMHMEHPLTGV